MITSNSARDIFLCAVIFGGWPLFIVLYYHKHRYALGIIFGLVVLTLLIGSTIASLGAALRTELPLYAWAALPYCLTALLLLRHRQIRQGDTTNTSANKK